MELLYTPTGGATQRYWYVLDGKGNVVALTTASGVVVDRYHYDVWGVPTIDREQVPQPLLYGGYVYDRELSGPGDVTASGQPVGWYWLSVRHYDPSLKRFLQPDPSEQEGTRSYVYAGDDPLDATDPDRAVVHSGLDRDRLPRQRRRADSYAGSGAGSARGGGRRSERGAVVRGGSAGNRGRGVAGDRPDPQRARARGGRAEREQRLHRDQRDPGAPEFLIRGR